MRVFPCNSLMVVAGLLALAGSSCLRSKAEPYDGGSAGDMGTGGRGGGTGGVLGSGGTPGSGGTVGTGGVIGGGGTSGMGGGAIGGGATGGGMGGVAGTGGAGVGGAPYCGDGIKNGTEQCDAAGSGSTSLGSCNPECTGFYEKKFLRETNGRYSGNLGGPTGADALCQAEFGNGWKALIVGGGRRATMTPLKGDGQTDWVVRKYTHYYNENDQLIWRTDDVALLGVRGGQRMNLYADAFFELSAYPWGGYDNNWVEVPRSDTPGASSGTCLGWTTIASGEDGTFPLPDLTMGRTEPCGAPEPLLCIQQ